MACVVVQEREAGGKHPALEGLGLESHAPFLRQASQHFVFAKAPAVGGDFLEIVGEMACKEITAAPRVRIEHIADVIDQPLDRLAATSDHLPLAVTVHRSES